MRDARSRCRPDFYVDSIHDVDFGVLRDLGVRGVLLDVDNTLVAPGSGRVADSVIGHLHRQRESAEIEKWALATNARRDLSALATAVGIQVVRAGWLIAKPRSAYYRRALAHLDLAPSEVAMVGDKALHDVIPAKRLGLWTVLVRPVWPDQMIDRLLLRRWRERRLH